MFCDEAKRSQLFSAVRDVVEKTLKEPNRLLNDDTMEVEHGVVEIDQEEEEEEEEEEDEQEEQEQEQEQEEEDEQEQEQEQEQEDQEEQPEESQEPEENNESSMTYSEVWKNQAWVVFWKRLIAVLDESDKNDLLLKEIVTPMKNSFLSLLETYPESLFLVRKLLKTKTAATEMKTIMKSKTTKLSKLFATGAYKGYDDVMQMLNAK